MDQFCEEEFFKCTQCGSIAEEPYESECCGKLYCSRCIVMCNGMICNNCQKSNSFHKNLFAKNLLRQIPLKCKHNCGGKYVYEEMKIHLLRCEAKLFRCKIDSCRFTGKKSALFPHVIESHPVQLLLLMENYEEFQEEIQKMKSRSENEVTSEKKTLQRQNNILNDELNIYNGASPFIPRLNIEMMRNQNVIEARNNNIDHNYVLPTVMPRLRNFPVNNCYFDLPVDSDELRRGGHRQPQVNARERRSSYNNRQTLSNNHNENEIDGNNRNNYSFTYNNDAQDEEYYFDNEDMNYTQSFDNGQVSLHNNYESDKS